MGPIVVGRDEPLLFPSYDILDKDRQGMKSSTPQRLRDGHKETSVPV